MYLGSPMYLAFQNRLSHPNPTWKCSALWTSTQVDFQVHSPWHYLHCWQHGKQRGFNCNSTHSQCISCQCSRCASYEIKRIPMEGSCTKNGSVRVQGPSICYFPLSCYAVLVVWFLDTANLVSTGKVLWQTWWTLIRALMTQEFLATCHVMYRANRLKATSLYRVFQLPPHTCIISVICLLLTVVKEPTAVGYPYTEEVWHQYSLTLDSQEIQVWLEGINTCNLIQVTRLQ